MFKTGQFLACVSALFFFYSCYYKADTSPFNGMWQLKTLQDADGRVIAVDTIYYSFQRDVVFSYTVLHEEEHQPPVKATPPLYGYLIFYSDKDLEIVPDVSCMRFDWFQWWGNYHVETINSKTLILSRNDTIFNFIQF